MDRLAPLANSSYRRWAIADFLSVIGTWMQSVAASWLVLQVTGSATRTGLIIASQALPALLFGPIAGRLADSQKFDARKVLVSTQLLLAASTFASALGALAFTHRFFGGNALADLLLLLAFINGVIHAIEGPNLGRFSLTLIGQEQIPAALSLGALLSSSGRIIGTAAAGLLALFGTPTIFALNALTFIVVALTLASLPSRAVEIEMKKSSGILSRELWIVLAASALLGGLGRNYQVTLGALSDQRGFGASGFAAASSLFAVGAAVGGLIAVLLVKKLMRHFFALAALAAALQISLGHLSSLQKVLTFIIPIAICGVLFDVTSSSLVQGRSNSEVRGRVIALQGVFGALGSIVGAPTLGYLSQRVGASNALQIAGSICLVVTLISFIAMSHARVIGVGVATWRKLKTQSITSLMITRSSEEPSNA